MPYPDVGIWFDVPEADYHSLTAASNSNLGKILRSPAHLKWDLDNPRASDTPAFRLGSAAHSILLEPHLFQDTYARGPDGDRRTKAVREEWKEKEESFGANYVLTPAQWDAVHHIEQAVGDHTAASRLLYAPGESEVTLIWDDAETGVRCKARIDRLPFDKQMGIGDLKTTKDASPKAFAKSLWAYGYHRQAAHYLNGLAVLDTPRRFFTFAAVEKEPPFGVAVYQIDDGSIDAGAHQIRSLLQIYARCQESGVWPAYPDEIQDIAIPPWAFSEIDRT